MNGSIGNKGDAWTYVGESASVIDYVVVNEKAVEEILEMTVEDRMESDHMLMKVRIQEPEGKREEKEVIM